MAHPEIIRHSKALQALDHIDQFTQPEDDVTLDDRLWGNVLHIICALSKQVIAPTVSVAPYTGPAAKKNNCRWDTLQGGYQSLGAV
jgi:hypothetical protein